MRSTRVSARLRVAAAIVAVGLATPLSALADRSAALAAITIENFGQVSETYYRGAQPSGQDYDRLRALGVTTVIDLQKDFAQQPFARTEEADVRAAGMQFYRIPMTTRVPPTEEQLALFLSIVNDPAQQPVYVHCKGGRHRTGVMTAAYRMTQQGWSADDAYDEMKKFKFGPGFLHPEFKDFVYDYHEELQTTRASAPVGTW